MTMNVPAVAGKATVHLFLPGAIARAGVEAMIVRLVAPSPEVRSFDCDRVLSASNRADLLVTDAQSAPGLMRRIPASSRPRRVLVLSAAGAPADATELLAGCACGRLSLQDELAQVTKMLQRAVGCREERGGASACEACPLPKTLQPQALPLSPRELDVFMLLGSGRGASEIADELGVSIKTYETHRERIKLKLGLQSASELVVRAMAWRRGLLDML